MSELEMLMGCAILFIIGIVWLMLNTKNKKLAQDDINWFKNTMNKEGIDNNQEGVLVLGHSMVNDFVVYTNMDYIYCVNQFKKQFKKIYKKDILNMDVEVYKYEKNVKRLVALTSTFDKNVIIGDVVFKMVTRDATYNITCMKNGKDGYNRSFTNRTTPVDDASRIKLMIEDDIKNLKETNI